MTITFRVDGTPKAQPRPRAFARKFGDGTVAARVYDSGTAEGWKSLIAAAVLPLRPAAPLDGPIRLDADFYFPRPKYMAGRKVPDGEIPHTARPDRDNLEKALLDCLTTVGVFVDDCQVCAGEVRKFYASKADRPGAVIAIQQFNPTRGHNPGDAASPGHTTTAPAAAEADVEEGARTVAPQDVCENDTMSL